jgi:hypothetical protein
MPGLVAEERQQREQGSPPRSWNSSTAKDSRPWRVASCRRSASEASTSAVEDIAQASPATSAACHESPSSHAQPESDDAGDSHLRAAQAENRTAQRPQPRRVELEADQEEEQHHAELGDVQGGFDVARHRQARGADQHPATR